MSDAPAKPLVLVVEDDPAIASLVSTALGANGLRHEVVATAAGAIAAAAEHAPSAILLDLGLPDEDGIEVVRRVRTWSDLPIIVVSARGEDADKIGALDAGADDYLTKPFSVGELLARVRVALRRASRDEGAAFGHAFSNGPLVVDYAAGIACVDGAELRLTPLEYRLLVLLSRNAGKVLTHQYLLERAWGPGQVGDLASLRVIMASLRRKIGPDLVQTHVGVGYRMQVLASA